MVSRLPLYSIRLTLGRESIMWLLKLSHFPALHLAPKSRGETHTTLLMIRYSLLYSTLLYSTLPTLTIKAEYSIMQVLDSFGLVARESDHYGVLGVFGVIKMVLFLVPFQTL